jgi:hypothetical protein
MAIIAKEDVLDAISDESDNMLDVLTEYWHGLNKESGATPENIVVNAKYCAEMLYAAKKYQESLDWLDAIGIEIAKTEGDESDAYSLFVQDPDLEDLRVRALDRSGLDTDEEEDEDIEDE